MKKLLSIMVAFVVLFSASALSFEDLTGEVVKNYMHSCQNVQLARGESVTVFAGLAYETVLEAQEIRSSSVRVTANGKDVTLRHGPHEILDSGAAIKVLFSDTSEKTQYTDVTRNSAVLEVCAFPEDEVKEALCHVPVEFKAGETQTICHADITFLSARPFMALLRVGGSDVELEVESHNVVGKVVQEVLPGYYVKVLTVSNNPQGDQYDRVTLQAWRTALPETGYNYGEKVTLHVGETQEIEGHTVVLDYVEASPVYQAALAHLTIDGNAVAVVESPNVAHDRAVAVGDAWLSVMFTTNCELGDYCDKAVVRLDKTRLESQKGVAVYQPSVAAKQPTSAPEPVEQTAPEEPSSLPPPEPQRSWWQRLVEFLFG